MRGLRAVLYLAVLLCVAQLASGAACAGAGGNFIDNAGQCVCLSGFSGEDCSLVAPAACSSSMTVANPTQADHFPKLDLASAAYTQNTLRVTLLGDYVSSRRYNSINFVGQNMSRCSLGFSESFWATNFTAGCQDSFHIDMPWIYHADCGFTINDHKEDSDDDLANEDNQTAIAQNHYVSFSSRFSLNYTDALGSIENVTLSRTTVVPYRIFVQFPTRLDVSLTNVKIQSIVELGFALTGDNFDPDTHELTIEFTVINSWPNMLEKDGSQWAAPVTPAGVNYEGSIAMTNDQATDCANDAVNKPLCKQIYTVKFSTDLCTYDGTYNFTATIFTCRGLNYDSCTNLDLHIAFDMSTSSICSTINTTLSLQGHLAPFHQMKTVVSDPTDVFYSDATADGFTIGSWGFFQVVLDDTQGNTIDLQFYEVSFQANGFTNKNYLMKNGNITNSDTLPALANADSADAFHYDEAKFLNYDSYKGFQVYFSSVVFKVLPSSVTTYTFRASCYATYLGNAGETKKREVEFVWDAAIEDQSVSTFAKVGLRQAATAVSGQKTSVSSVDSSNLAYIIGGGGAGLVLIVLAVIGLAIRHKKRQVSKALAEATRA